MGVRELSRGTGRPARHRRELDEAAAFAAWSGKSLPTIFHWSRVADQRMSGVVAPRSNFQGRGLMKVGASGGMNRYGAFDMAGNAKEWCWNSASDDKRYILGGGWDEPAYLFNDPDARSPFERAANFGFRCVKYADDDTVAKSGERVAYRRARLLPRAARRRRCVRRVPDAVRIRQGRSRGARRGSTIRDRTGGSRGCRTRRPMAASECPRSCTCRRRAQPPYQTVVYFPARRPFPQRSSAEINTRPFDWVIKSGRAFIYPIYKSTFERGDEITTDYSEPDQHVSRARDRLGERCATHGGLSRDAADIDRGRIAYMGLSWGGAMAPVFLASSLDSRRPC